METFSSFPVLHSSFGDKMAKRTPQDLKHRRHLRLRQRVTGTAARPRLCVNRTLKHIHAQIIDDVNGVTLAAASTVQDAVGAQIEGGKGSVAAARVVGQIMAERAKEKGIDAVVFDRNGNQYHGAIKELAEAARAGGLQF
jgi:large subunit ribosomal protein L18